MSYAKRIRKPINHEKTDLLDILVTSASNLENLDQLADPLRGLKAIKEDLDFQRVLIPTD